MFGFSFAKLVLILLVVAAVWGSYRIVRARSRIREAGDARPRKVGAEEMVACPTCGTYVPAIGASSCDRQDCPY